ncbi:MAG TPA: hypothetical protein VJ406_02805, partial [Dehalococcoidia bacterium]|nr:hypothetical protein [Dehalococcoidia bacterium]
HGIADGGMASPACFQNSDEHSTTLFQGVFFSDSEALCCFFNARSMATKQSRAGAEIATPRQVGARNDRVV